MKRLWGSIAKEHYGAFHEIPRHCYGKKGGCLVYSPA